MTENYVPRSAERRPLGIMVKGRVKSRVVYVDMIDISEMGCKIRGTRGFTDVGDVVSMKVGDINAPLGSVVWVKDRIAGVQFDGKIHEAVLDHMFANLDPETQLQKQRLHRL